MLQIHNCCAYGQIIKREFSTCKHQHNWNLNFGIYITLPKGPNQLLHDSNSVD